MPLLTVDWPNRVINVSRADMPLIQASPIEIRELDINAFRYALRAAEASPEGVVFPPTHLHNEPVPLATFDVPRVVQIINDYVVTFEDGQYVVSITGGNHNIGTRRTPNQVSVSENLSAGLVQSRDIEHASFNGGVTVDVVRGIAGTTFPIGTGRQPVNNMADAALIAAIRGLPNIYFMSNMSITSGTWHAINFIAAVGDVTLTFGQNAEVSHTRVVGATVTGHISSPKVTLEKCRCVDLTYRGEFMYTCTLRGTITLLGDENVTLAQCMDDDATPGVPVIDMAGFTGELALRDWFGGVRIINKTAPGSVAVDMRGLLQIDSTVTAGSFVVRGIGHIVDESSGTTVEDRDLLTSETIARAVLADPRALTLGKFVGLK